MTLADLIARARERQPLVGFDPAELVEPERELERQRGRRLTAAERRRAVILGELLAELLVARERREPWYVWIKEEWPAIKAANNSGSDSTVGERSPSLSSGVAAP